MEKMNEDDDKMIRSPSSEGKMVIKLKIPKLEVERTPEKEVIGILPEKEEKKICIECGKGFSSGKALGGHMRIHVHPHVQSGNKNKNPSFLKPLKTTKFKKPFPQDLPSNGDLKMIKSKPYYMNSVNDEGKPTCSQCGKSFPSMKSLFGHMRCHPERIWRGILPPPNTPKNPNSSSASSSFSSEKGGKIDGDGDQVVDLMKFLSGWSKTDRRGRISKPAEEEEEDEGLMDIAEDLLSLANAVGSPAESIVTPLKLEENINLRTMEYGSGKGKAVMEEEMEVKPVAKMELDDECMIDFFSDEKSCKKMKKRKKMKVITDLQQQQHQQQLQQQQQQQRQQLVVMDCKYKCTTCNKTFPTHQALGGHRSSHYKPRFVSTDRYRIGEEEVAFVNGFTVAIGGNGILHQCKMCDKVFATGQALGGHQRCHWTGTMVAQTPSSQVTSAGDEGSPRGCKRRVLDFDLNEVPLGMMEEDEVGNENGNGNGNGYASSSNNSNIC